MDACLPPSRRAFLATSLAAAPYLLSAAVRGAEPRTARQIVEQIRQAFGPSWRDTPTDSFHAGDPDVAVTGIATTVMSTLDVLQRATKGKLNLVITHEPTFYTGNDNVTDLVDNALYLQKVEFIRTNQLAVFRLHDNWHSRRPEPMGQALADALGWGAMRSADEPDVFVISPTTLAAVIRLIEEKLGVHSFRVIGKSTTPVARVGFLPGTPPSPTAVSRLMPRVDLVVAGEQREWEGVYFAHDMVTSGAAKAMITLGHAISEDPGMRLCADWLKSFITDLPIQWIAAGEPFTRRG